MTSEARIAMSTAVRMGTYPAVQTFITMRRTSTLVIATRGSPGITSMLDIVTSMTMDTMIMPDTVTDHQTNAADTPTHQAVTVAADTNTILLTQAITATVLKMN